MDISIIGCGTMGKGIATVLSKGNKLLLCDHHQGRAATLAQEIGATAAKNATEAVQKSELVILAVKPQDFSNISREIKSTLNGDKTIVSILAGITLSQLQDNFKPSAAVRMMPNLPLIYGKGVIGIVDDSTLSEQAKGKLETVFAPLGFVKWLPERLFNALTALTGSGPAFAMVMIESMVDAGIAMGFDADTAKMLVIQMLEGSLTMLKETGKHPAEIKWEITSPGGTTIAGLKAMEAAGVRSGIINTFLATQARSIEMAQGT